METIFDYIEEQEKKYQMPIPVVDGWDWSMKDHIKRSFLYLNSQFEEANEDRNLRPFQNIVLPILNIQFRLEGFDVKDIALYVENKDEYYKSLLIKKYHDKWALENSIDTFIDEVVESYATYGGVLVRKTKKAKPEVIDLKTLAFCNQKDILNHPFGILHELSFSELRGYAKKLGWGGEGSDIGIEDLIELVKKEDDNNGVVKVYEVHGSMPIEWLNGEEIVEESEEDLNQIQVVAFYKKPEGQKVGVTLFKKRMPKSPFKFLARDDVKGRALGRGGVEELFDSQIWTNWNQVKIAEMLDSASKTLFYSDDATFKTRNNLNDAENNEVFNIQEGKSLAQVDSYPRNLAVFNDSVERFFQHAQILGSAPEALMGEEPSSGTPFKLYEAQQMEGKGMHRYRQGKIATFMDEIYREWILPHLAIEIVKEQNFMQELSAEEMQGVVEAIVTKKANEFKKRMILSLQEVDEEMVELYKEQIKMDVAKGGNKRFFKILKDEMKDITVTVMTNIAGKQKNLALLTDKLVNVFRQFISTPQLRDDPDMVNLFNTILESSGLSPITFGPSPNREQMALPQGGGSTQPVQDLAQSQANAQQ